jgi:2-oxoglutarate dehydrogenase E1 component
LGAFEIMTKDILAQFYGPNAGYVLELYEKYLDDPLKVDPPTRAIFERWPPLDQLETLLTQARPPIAVDKIPTDKVTAAANLAQAIRTFGHLSAELDPLGSPPPGDPWHRLSFHGLTEDDLRQLPTEVIGGPVAQSTATAYEALQDLRTIYMDHIGYDYGHIQLPEERDWLRHAAENGTYRPPADPIDEQKL